jgi:hypothetical protein
MYYHIRFNKFLGQASVLSKKTARNCLALLAASVVLSGAAQAQDKAALTHQNIVTDSTAHITLEPAAGPTLAWGQNMQVSGLVVDLIKPQQTWTMLAPSMSSPYLSAPIPSYLLPISAPLSLNDNLAVHKPGIAFFSFSF